MKKLCTILLGLLLGPGTMLLAQCEQNTLPGSTVNVWDWRDASYEFYFQGYPGPLTKSSPFYAGFPVQENVTHLVGPPRDFDPADGWELVWKDFGSAQNGVNFPALVLYNRYNALLRVLLYVRSDGTNAYQGALINLHQLTNEDQFIKNSSLLEHLNSPMSALDNFEKGLNGESINKFYNVPPPSHDGTWLVADYVTAYDPCTCDHGTMMRVQPTLTSVSAISLDIFGQSSTIPIYSSGGGVTANPFTAALGGAASAVNTIGSHYEKGQKTFKNLSGFSDFTRDEIFPLLTSPFNSVPASLPSWLQAIPYVGTAISVLDMLIGGGSDTPKTISSYSGTYQFEATGTLTTNSPHVPVLIKTPGAKTMTNWEAYEPVYDNALGIFNLLYTPVVHQAVEYREEDSGIPEYPLDRTYYYSYKFDKTNLKYVFNADAGLSLDPDNILVALVFSDCGYGMPISSMPQGLRATGLDRVYTTPYMPIECLHDYSLFMQQTINGGYFFNDDCNEVKLKVLATLNRADGLGSDIAYIATYRTAVVTAPYAYDYTPANPYLNIQDVLEIDFSVFIQGGNFFAWDKIIVKNFPVSYLITPWTRWNIHTKELLFTDPDGLQVVVTDPNFKISGSAPCESVPPASAQEIAFFCANIYNPLSSVLTPDGPEYGVMSALVPGQDGESGTRITGVHPQPASDHIRVGLTDCPEYAVLRLSDLYGRAVQQVMPDSGNTDLALDLALIRPGFYILQLLDAENRVLAVRKVIKR